MKIARHIVSDKGILVTTVVLLMIAAALAIAGIRTDLHAQAAEMAPVVLGAGSGVPHYVLQAVMGHVPSTAGTLLSFALLLSSVVTPFTAALLIAIQASFEPDHQAEEFAAADAVYAA